MILLGFAVYFLFFNSSRIVHLCHRTLTPPIDMKRFNVLAIACCLLTTTQAQTYVQLNPSAAQSGQTVITGPSFANYFVSSQTTPIGGVGHFVMTASGVARWTIGAFGQETSTNSVGSDFSIFGYDNSGSYIGSYFYMQRATGFTSIGYGPGTTPLSMLHLRMPANGASALNSTLTFGYPSDAGNTNVPIGGVSGGYNIDFNTWRDIQPSQIGARIRAERINNYSAGSALIQSMDLAFSTSNGGGPTGLTEKMRIKSNGNIGIGTANPQSLLSVSGTVTAKQVIVTTTGWSDFVFARGYALPSLDSVAVFSARYGHLPGIPSAADLAAGGLDLGAMQKAQMQKIEELTLYQVDANKKIATLTAENTDLRHGLADLRQELAALKAALQDLQAAQAHATGATGKN